MHFTVLLGTTAALLAGTKAAPQSTDQGKAAKAQHLEPWAPEANQGPLGRWSAALRLRRLQSQAAQGYNGTNSTTVGTKPTYVFPTPGPGYSSPSLPEEGPDVTDCPGYVFVSTTTVEVTQYVTEGGSEDTKTNAPGYDDNASQTVVNEDTTTLKYDHGTEAPYAEHTTPVFPPYQSLDVSTTTTKSINYGYASEAPYPGNTTTAVPPYHSANVSTTTTKSIDYGYASEAPYPGNTTTTVPPYHSANISMTTTKPGHGYESDSPYAENTTPAFPSYHPSNVSTTTTKSSHEYKSEDPYSESTRPPFPSYHSANVSTKTTKLSTEYEAEATYSENTTPLFPSYHSANVSTTQTYGSETLIIKTDTTEPATTRSADEYREYGPQPPLTTSIVPPVASTSIYKNVSSILSAEYSSEVVTLSESSVTIESSSTVLISETEVTVSPYETVPAYGPGYDVPSYDATGYNPPGYEAPGYEAPSYEAPGYEVPYDAATPSESLVTSESSGTVSIGETEVPAETSAPTPAYTFVYGEPSEVVTLSESTISVESSGSVFLSETQVTVSPSESAPASESSASVASDPYPEGEETSTGVFSATDYFSTYAATEPLPTKTGDCVIDTSIVPVSTAPLTSLPATIEDPTKTVSEGDVPTGKPEAGSRHCGVHGKPVGNYFLARFVENSPGVPVTLEGCYQFCDSVMDATDGCESYRFYPERGLDVARCDLYGSNVAYALDSVDDYYPDIWFDLDCGSPRSDRWAHLPGLERLESLGLE